MRFIRKNGRIIPIRESSKVDYKGLGMGVSGAAISIGAASKVSSVIAKRFGVRAGLVGLLGSVFIGEALAAEGIDKFTESLHFKKRSEQNLKNFAGGLVGVLGALSALRGIRR